MSEPTLLDMFTIRGDAERRSSVEDTEDMKADAADTFEMDDDTDDL
ncbi:MAG: hypothetical protein ACJ72W_04955 [Actinoallomurus sp.]